MFVVLQVVLVCKRNEAKKADGINAAMRKADQKGQAKIETAPLLRNQLKNEEAMKENKNRLPSGASAGACCECSFAAVEATSGFPRWFRSERLLPVCTNGTGSSSLASLIGAAVDLLLGLEEAFSVACMPTGMESAFASLISWSIKAIMAENHSVQS